MYKEVYKKWLKSPVLLPAEVLELKNIQNDEKEIEYRFGKDLEFGTAGMRGLLGLGTNMMNVYTVKKATQGLADYIKSLGVSAIKRGVAISFDTRKNSDVFAKASADVLTANGIKVYLFKDVHPVPMLSFAVRELKAIAGIMITASHNPKEYNGYKVYGEDGAQMSIEDTAKVVECIDKIGDCLSNKIIDVLPEGEKRKIVYLTKSFDKKYYKKIKKLVLSKKEIKQQAKDLKLVYTPVHGSGFVPVMTILKKLGITPLLVEEQTTMDSSFPTVEVPNPEYKKTLEMGIALANKQNADVVFGTDPDCDRLGVAIRNDKGEFEALTGNQVGALLLEYILHRLKETGKLPENGFVAKSFVSTVLAKAIAEEYGVELFETGVGFKFIGEKIKLYERSGEKQFIFGFEESCGYLRGIHCRDKDAVVASMLFVDMACYYSAKKVSIYQKLKDLYDKYGYVLDVNISTNYSGLNAMKEMTAVVEKLKATKIDKIDIYNVIATRDYSVPVRRLTDGTEEPIDIAKSNTIYYEFENGSFVCVRPSGTEPKLKVYYSIKAKDKATAEKNFAKISAAVEALIK